MSMQSYGEKMAGVGFNPSNDERVERLKASYASIIDEMNNLRNSTEIQEQKRQCSIAITEAQTAQMWAVKALFAKD